MVLSVSTPSPDELVIEYMDFARRSACKVVTSLDLPIEIDDAIQYGYEGLIQAAHRFDASEFDPTLGTLDNNFKSFAYKRIVGSVIDKVRSGNFVKRRGVEKGIHFHMESIDEYREGEYGDMPAVQLEAISGDPDLSIDFKNALKVLNDRERHIVLSLAVGMRGHDLAEELGLSDSRISQLAADARSKLAKAMDIEWSAAA